MDLLLQRAKGLLPLPDLLAKLGDATPSGAQVARGFLIRSPLREDRNPSFSVYIRNGVWRWSDKATGEGGDEVDYLARRDGLTNGAARRRYLEMTGMGVGETRNGERGTRNSERGTRNGGLTYRAGKPVGRGNEEVGTRNAEVGTRISEMGTRKVEAGAAVPGFSWESCRAGMGEAAIRRLAEWRGYEPEFVGWLRQQGWVGDQRGSVAMPVHDSEGRVVSCHFRTATGWAYLPGTKPTALVLGDPRRAGLLVLMESQWDAFAALQAIEAHRRPEMLDLIAIAVSRGASNAALLAPVVQAATEAGKRIAAFEQNDPPPEPGAKPYGNWVWSREVAKLGRGICFAGPPPEHGDANDWLRAGMTGTDFLTRLESGRPKRTTTLSLRTVAELRSMTFDDSDCYLGDRMLAAGQATSFLGPGGIGKSRMVLQLAVCCILGMPFLGLETRARGRRWLILQTENSNRRLRADLERLIRGLELGEESLRLLNRGLMFHTLEQDHDALLDLGDPETADDVAAAVHDTDPDIVVLDPLNTFTSGDLNSDRDCRAVITAISRLVKRGRPDRVPFVVHHSLTGKAGASKAVGWDRGSYGRNSKVLHAWVRSQWNLAPADADDETRLILACGKNNNGRPFDEIGVVYDEESGIYRVDEDFDGATYRASLGAEGGMRKKGAAWTIEDVATHLGGEWTRTGPLQRRVCEESGMSRAQFYRLWQALKETSRVTENERGEWRRAEKS